MNNVFFQLPQKPPKWLDCYGEFMSNRQGVTTFERANIERVITQMKNNWPEFNEQHGKPKVVLTPEEKTQKKRKTLQNRAQDVNFWDGIIQNPDEDSYAKSFAKRRKEMLMDENQNKRPKKSEDVLEALLRKDDEEVAEDDESPPRNDQSAPESSLSEIDDREEDEEEEEKQTTEDAEEGDEEQYVAKKEKVFKEEKPMEKAVIVRTSGTLSILTPTKKNTLMEAANKKLAANALVAMKQNFYRKIKEIGIGDGDQIVKMFDKVYNTLIDQNEALNSVDSLITCYFK